MTPFDGMGAKLTKKGQGLKSVARNLALSGFGSVGVVAGVLGRAPARQSNGNAPGAVELAVIHEFGLGVPERSFLRSTFDQMQTKWFSFAKRLLRGVAQGKVATDAAMAILGERMKTDVRAKIRAGIDPSLAAGTIAAKGSSKPLIDTGQLLNSVDYEVRKK